MIKASYRIGTEDLSLTKGMLHDGLVCLSSLLILVPATLSCGHTIRAAD